MGLKGRVCLFLPEYLKRKLNLKKKGFEKLRMLVDWCDNYTYFEARCRDGDFRTGEEETSDSVLSSLYHIV